MRHSATTHAPLRISNTTCAWWVQMRTAFRCSMFDHSPHNTDHFGDDFHMRKWCRKTVKTKPSYKKKQKKLNYTYRDKAKSNKTKAWFTPSRPSSQLQHMGLQQFQENSTWRWRPQRSSVLHAQSFYHSSLGITTRSSATAEIARDEWNTHSRSLKVIVPFNVAYMTSY